MTITITNPQAITQILNAVTSVPDTAEAACAECTAGYGWCDGGCRDTEPVEPGDEEWQDDDYHCGAVAPLPMMRFTRNGWRDLHDVSLIVRHDENEGDDSQPLIMIDYPHRDCGIAMTARQARINAAWLMNAADLLDPLPTGAMATTAVNVRIGDLLDTPDGWQKVTGLLFDAAIEQASVFTTARTLDDSDGWGLSFNDPVTVRRPLHGSCAIQFIEPIPGGTR